MTDPYRIPEDGRYRTINVSGGRSSGYMLRQILDAHDGTLPDRTAAVFCNTGKERTETLDFVRDMSAHWAVSITWLEYRYRADAAGGQANPRHTFAVVDHASASRGGEPFEQLITAKHMLPNTVMRFCTAELKVKTVERYAASIGFKRLTQTKLLGIRADERARIRRLDALDNQFIETPMVAAGVDRATVGEFWDRAPFDLRIDSSVGNCDLCFMRGRKQTANILRNEPDLANWWLRMEETINARFRVSHSIPDLLALAAEPPMPTLGLPEPIGIDCICGD